MSVCQRRAGALRVLAVITEPAVIAAILEHLEHLERAQAHAPPVAG